MPKAQRILIYVLRHDLRLADNPVFTTAAKAHDQFTHLIPLFVLNPIQYELSGFLRPSEQSPFPEARSRIGHFWRCGPYRTKFLAESLFDLKKSLQEAGSDLIIRTGETHSVVRSIIDALNREGSEVKAVWVTRDFTAEELDEERRIRKALPSSVSFKVFDDESTLICRKDVPYPISELPDVFTSFKKSVEPLRANARVAIEGIPSIPPLPIGMPPQTAPFLIPGALDDFINALQKPLLEKPDVPLISFPEGTRSAHSFVGGSTAAHERIAHLLSSGAASRYKDTRNGLLGEDFSTKLSAYLAHGCISAAQIHSALKEWEDRNNDGRENKGSAAIRFELLWRDYMRFCLEKYGADFFQLYGFGRKGRKMGGEEWRTPSSADPGAQDAFKRWLTGRTSTGLIDAAQRELLLTGYMSNRARQNTASFLATRLHIDWRLGAEWFESMLVDYDCASNWGNWAHVAGVGNDPRENRMFNPVKQANDYDPEGKYIRTWVEEARGIEDVGCVWQLWKLHGEERKKRGIEDPLVKIEWSTKKRAKTYGRFKNEHRSGGGGGPKRQQ
ncbi:cryptochrome [Sanghuangporus baumii]|uniref:Cryptochrome DASH n=1 Tax=Sanghuangporus baumii TaxID=108892 RepID=A0A9Q5HU26_SANBA|nr:cryptochrome [Sanghuangporus baumii]